MPVTSELSGIRRLAYEGAVDADGHVLEPPDLWERYLEARFRDRRCASCTTTTVWKSSRLVVSVQL